MKVVLGPATVGGIQAGAFKIGDTAGTIDNIIQCKLYRPGSVGFVSKSVSHRLRFLIAMSCINCICYTHEVFCSQKPYMSLYYFLVISKDAIEVIFILGHDLWIGKLSYIFTCKTKLYALHWLSFPVYICLIVQLEFYAAYLVSEWLQELLTDFQNYRVVCPMNYTIQLLVSLTEFMKVCIHVGYLIHHYILW